MANNFLNRKFRYSYNNAVAYLIGANFLVFLAVSFVKPVISGIPLVYWLSLFPPFVREGYVWQFFTYMFVHTEFIHLFFNTYALFMFGTMLERAIGTKEFLLFYFVTGVLSGAIGYCIYMLTGTTLFVLMGASGAIYALLFLTSVMYPQGRILLFFFIPMKLPVAIIVFIAIELVSQVGLSGGGTANLVHLAGMAVAWVYCLVRFRISPVKVWRNALR